MAKKGRKYGDITNTKGNIMAMGSGVKSHKTWVKNTQGYYYVAFTKKYRGVSELDISLKEGYAVDLVSEYMHIPKDFLQLSLKKENLTQTSLDTVYYVRQGVRTIGKMSISVRRYGDTNELLFIYADRHYRGKRDTNRKQLNHRKTN